MIRLFHRDWSVESVESVGRSVLLWVEKTRDFTRFCFFFCSGDKPTNREPSKCDFANSRGNAGTRENERRRGADEIFDCVMDGCAAHVDVRANERTRKGFRTTR